MKSCDTLIADTWQHGIEPDIYLSNLLSENSGANGRYFSAQDMISKSLPGWEIPCDLSAEVTRAVTENQQDYR